jgi:stearoyl-CoA desaturase (delta-9 desaturase)
LSWVAVHRGYHHRWSDTQRDLHSPIHGRFHAFFGWTLGVTESSNTINLKYAANLLRKPNHLWFHKNQFFILWGVPLLLALIDWHFSLAALCLPVAISLIQDNLVNVLGHDSARIGYRNYDTRDNSVNNIILGYCGWGQGWHNNHHHQPASYDFGSGVSGRRWEWDPCRLWLPLLNWANK